MMTWLAKFREQAPFVLFIALFVVIYANLAWLANASSALGALLGLFLGISPAINRRLGERFSQHRLESGIGVVTLLLVTAAMSWQVYPVITDRTSALPGQSLPLFIAALALYVRHVYLVHRSDESRGEVARPTSLLLTLCTATIISSYALMVMWLIKVNFPVSAYITDKFLERGIIPPLTWLLFIWGVLLQADKWLMLNSVFPQLRQKVQDGEYSTERALTSIYRARDENDLLPQYIGWAIPILGFIGTVLGISLASAGIQSVIGSQQGISAISSELGAVIAPLGIAFDTTLIALSLSIVLTLSQTLLQRWEESSLTRLSDELQGST